MYFEQNKYYLPKYFLCALQLNEKRKGNDTFFPFPTKFLSRVTKCTCSLSREV